MRILNFDLFEEIEEEAKTSPRLRMSYDLRTQAMDEAPSWQDTSQRMLNVMMKNSVVPVHRHTNSSETIIVLRGSGDEVFYDESAKRLSVSPCVMVVTVLQLKFPEMSYIPSYHMRMGL